MHPIQAELNRMVHAGLPGAFVYIEEVDGRSHFYTAGVADLASQRRMTPDSRYRVGSTTKTFTAVVTLQLVAEGRLTLHDTVARWLPNLAVPNADRLTIEHLLRMRSGLFDFEDDPSLRKNLEAHLKPYRLDEAVGLAIKHGISFSPGEKFRYCNTNFCILEMIIEQVTGHTLHEELTYRIFEPLGMSSTRYPAAEDLSLPEPYIRGYEQTADGWRECSHIFFGRGDGALISTALDQARFFRALLGGALLPDMLLKQMMDVIPDEPPAAEAYGMGLLTESLPCGRIWGHAGSGYGYTNDPYLHLATERFVVCMLNGTYNDTPEDSVPTTKWPSFSREIRAVAYC